MDRDIAIIIMTLAYVLFCSIFLIWVPTSTDVKVLVGVLFGLSWVIVWKDEW